MNQIAYFILSLQVAMLLSSPSEACSFQFTTLARARQLVETGLARESTSSETNSNVGVYEIEVGRVFYVVIYGRDLVFRVPDGDRFVGVNNSPELGVIAFKTRPANEMYTPYAYAVMPNGTIRVFSEEPRRRPLQPSMARQGSPRREVNLGKLLGVPLNVTPVTGQYGSPLAVAQRIKLGKMSTDRD